MWMSVPQPGIKPVAPVLEVQMLKHWTSREVAAFFLYVIFVSSWQVSDNLMPLKMYVCDVIFNTCLAPFYILTLKS